MESFARCLLVVAAHDNEAEAAEALATELAAEAHDAELLPQRMTLKLQLSKRVTLHLLLQKRWMLMLQLPNLLPKRHTLNCYRSA